MTCYPHAHRESAITLIEMVIVVVIMLVLMGLGINQLMSARSNARNIELRTTATAMAESIKAFRVDRASRAPEYDSDEWPLGQVASGPRDLEDRPYMRPRPDALATGNVTVTAYNGADPSVDDAGDLGLLEYERIDETRWRIRTFRRHGSDLVLVCVAGRELSGVKPC